MYRIPLLALILLLVSCSGCKKNQKPVEVESMSEIADEKDRVYHYEAEKLLDDKSWLRVFTCDGTLFNALHYVAGGEYVDVDQAESDTPGKWCREPECQCYAEERSGSEFSHDGATGLMLYWWHRGDLEAVERFIGYLESTNYILGTGNPGATYLRPTSQATLYQLRYALGGGDNDKRHFPPTFSKQEDYAAHIQSLHIYLRSLVYGAITEAERDLIEAYASDEPNNGIFQAIEATFTGDPDPTLDVLVGETYWPLEELPTGENFCTHYLFERSELRKQDINPDWLACEDEEEREQIWPATSYRLSLAILKNRIGKRFPKE